MVFSEAGQPEMTDEEKLAAIAQQYAVLNNRTSGTEIKWVGGNENTWHDHSKPLKGTVCRLV